MKILSAICWGLIVLTYKPLDLNGGILGTTVTDDVVLKHQAISIHSAD